MDTQGHPRETFPHSFTLYTPNNNHFAQKQLHSLTHSCTYMHHPNTIYASHSLQQLHSNTQTPFCIILSFHHSASSFHFISIQPIPSITKLKNSTTNNIPPSLPISTFTLSKHHFTPILIYFIHHINTKKYLQLLYSNST